MVPLLIRAPTHHLLTMSDFLQVPFEKESAAVNKSVDDCLDLIQTYAHHDPHDTSTETNNNPWTSPETLFATLDQARDRLKRAWEDLEDAIKTETHDPEAPPKQMDEDRVKVAYMDMITDACGDVLEQMRHAEGDNLDVDVLVDCLQSGLELWTMEEKELLLESDEVGESELTPQEARRRQMGYRDLEVESTMESKTTS